MSSQTMRSSRTSLRQITEKAAHADYLNDGSLDCYFRMSKVTPRQKEIYEKS